MSEPTLMTPLSRIDLGSSSASGAALVLVSLLLDPLSLVWSPQPVRSSAPATAIAPTAAVRERAAVVRRVVLAVMVVPPADGWSADGVEAVADRHRQRRRSRTTHVFERRDPVRLRHLAIRTEPIRGPAMSKSDNRSHPHRTSAVHHGRTGCGNLPFRPEDL